MSATTSMAPASKSRLEGSAADSSLPSRELNQRQRRFVKEYLKDFNATRAARRTGYSEKSAAVCGCELLRNPKVKAEVDRLADAALDAIGHSRESMLQRVGRIVMADIRKLVDKDGNLLPLSKLDADTAAAVASVDYEERKTRIKSVKGDGEGDDDILTMETEGVRKIRLHNPVDAFEKVARVRGWFKDHVDVTHKLDLLDLVGEVVARRRARVAAGEAPDAPRAALPPPKKGEPNAADGVR